MGVSKVEFGNESLIDLTSDTVNESNLLSGYTAHGADGELVEGGVIVTEITNITYEQYQEMTEEEKASFTGVISGYPMHGGGGSGGGKINYSTEEQDTGLKGVNGETIYQKTYIGNSGSGESINIDNTFFPSTRNIYDISGCFNNGTNMMSIGSTISVVPEWTLAPHCIDGTGLLIFQGSMMHNSDYIVTVMYTKLS